jgi:hypothetical protein
MGIGMEKSPCPLTQSSSSVLPSSRRLIPSPSVPCPYFTFHQLTQTPTPHTHTTTHYHYNTNLKKKKRRRERDPRKESKVQPQHSAPHPHPHTTKNNYKAYPINRNRE